MPSPPVWGFGSKYFQYNQTYVLSVTNTYPDKRLQFFKDTIDLPQHLITKNHTHTHTEKK